MTVRSAWQRVRLTRAGDEIVSQIRAALFEGRLRPGDQIGSEVALAEQFGVSRISVRDALRTLEASGIVEIRVGSKGGVRIAHGDPNRFADALAVQLRLVGITTVEAMDTEMGIEWVAAQLAATNGTPDDLAEMDRLLDEARNLVDSPFAFAECSGAFHTAVAAASHNRVIMATMSAIREVLDEAHRQHTTTRRAERVIQVHQAILDAIKKGDSREAGRLMQEHIGLAREQAADQPEIRTARIAKGD
ncbi:MAG: FadR family transcriptional regulator [Chloroflexi bacterium]|nr:FadR family transcriptional regulator [Chloroflexota bacterium]